MTFESAMEELEGLVRALQGGNIPLDEAILKYEQGNEKIRFCREKLAAAEEKIRQLSSVESVSGSEVSSKSDSDDAPQSGNDDIPF